NGFVEVVKDLRMEHEESLHLNFGEREGHGDSVAIVVVSDVMSPIEKARSGATGIGFFPIVEINFAVATVDFENGSDEHDDVFADLFNLRRIFNGETVGEFHEHFRRAGSGRMNRAGEPVKRLACV